MIKKHLIAAILGLSLVYSVDSNAASGYQIQYPVDLTTLKSNDSGTNGVPSLVSCGVNFCYALVDSEVWFIGANADGESGTGSSVSSIGKWVNTGLRAKSIVSGNNAGFAIGIDDYVYSTGLGTYGVLGTGSTSSVNKWTKTNLQAKQISAGTEDTVAIGLDGYVYGTGRNRSGALGVNDFTQRTSWVNSGFQAVEVATGYRHTLARTSSGEIFATGSNTDGEYGDGTNTTSLIFKDTGIAGIKIMAGTYSGAVITSAKELYVAGYTYMSLPTPNRWTKIANNVSDALVTYESGTQFAVISNGHVFVSGYNGSGYMLGLDSSIPSLVTMTDTGLSMDSFLSNNGFVIGKNGTEIWGTGVYSFSPRFPVGYGWTLQNWTFDKTVTPENAGTLITLNN